MSNAVRGTRTRPRAVAALTSLLIAAGSAWGGSAAATPAAADRTQLVAAPARTAPTFTVTVDIDDITAPTHGCIRNYFTLDVTVSPDVTSWTAEPSADGPNGPADTSYGLSGGAGTSSQRGNVLICDGIDDPGTYELSVVVRFFSSGGPGALPYMSASTQSSDTFKVETLLPKLALTLSDATPRKGDPVTVTVRGWFSDGTPVKYGRIYVQSRVGSRWITYPWSRDRLGNRGTTRLKGRAVETVVLRAQLKAEDSWKAATSKPVTMRVHR
jgi:hypothetical protein